MPENLHCFPKKLPPLCHWLLCHQQPAWACSVLLSHPLPAISWATPARKRCKIKTGTKDPFPARAEADGKSPADFSNTNVVKNRSTLSSLLRLQLVQTYCTCLVRGNIQFLAIESLIKRPLFLSVIFGPSLPRVSSMTFHAASNQFSTGKQCESWLPEGHGAWHWEQSWKNMLGILGHNQMFPNLDCNSVRHVLTSKCRLELKTSRFYYSVTCKSTSWQACCGTQSCSLWEIR